LGVGVGVGMGVGVGVGVYVGVGVVCRVWGVGVGVGLSFVIPGTDLTTYTLTQLKVFGGDEKHIAVVGGTAVQEKKKKRSLHLPISSFAEDEVSQS
jgi:hypothetical protein